VGGTQSTMVYGSRYWATTGISWVVLVYDNNVIVSTQSMVDCGWYSDYKWSIVGYLVLGLRWWIVGSTVRMEGYDIGRSANA